MSVSRRDGDYRVEEFGDESYISHGLVRREASVNYEGEEYGIRMTERCDDVRVEFFGEEGFLDQTFLESDHPADEIPGTEEELQESVAEYFKGLDRGE